MTAAAGEALERITPDTVSDGYALFGERIAGREGEIAGLLAAMAKTSLDAL